MGMADPLNVDNDGYIFHGIGDDPDDREYMTVPMERAAVKAMSKVVAQHQADFDAALAPFGLSHRDMLMPHWERPMRKADLERLQYLGGSSQTKTWDIWMEGYQATGESSAAIMLALNVEADSFNNAVWAYLESNPEMISYAARRDGVWRIWGRRLFSDEESARKSFG